MNDEQLLVVIAGAHRASMRPNGGSPLRERALPRHRARRPHWKPESSDRVARHARERHQVARDPVEPHQV